MKFLLGNAPRVSCSYQPQNDVMKEHTFCYEAPSACSTDKRQNTMTDNVLVLQIS